MDVWMRERDVVPTSALRLQVREIVALGVLYLPVACGGTRPIASTGPPSRTRRRPIPQSHDRAHAPRAGQRHPRVQRGRLGLAGAGGDLTRFHGPTGRDSWRHGDRRRRVGNRRPCNPTVLPAPRPDRRSAPSPPDPAPQPLARCELQSDHRALGSPSGSRSPVPRS